MNLHDRSHFEIYAFSYSSGIDDKMHLRIKAGVDHFYDVRTMSYEDVAMLARSLEIDIAVDLGGIHSHILEREYLPCQRLPIQASYIRLCIGTLGGKLLRTIWWQIKQ